MDLKESLKWICAINVFILTQAHTIHKRDVMENVSDDQHLQSLRKPQKYIIEPVETLSKVPDNLVAPPYDLVNFGGDSEIESHNGEDLYTELTTSTEKEWQIEQDISTNNYENYSDTNTTVINLAVNQENGPAEITTQENKNSNTESNFSINNLRVLAAENSDKPKDTTTTESSVSVINIAEKEIEIPDTTTENFEKVVNTVNNNPQLLAISKSETIKESSAPNSETKDKTELDNTVNKPKFNESSKTELDSLVNEQKFNETSLANLDKGKVDLKQVNSTEQTKPLVSSYKEKEIIKTKNNTSDNSFFNTPIVTTTLKETENQINPVVTTGMPLASTLAYQTDLNSLTKIQQTKSNTTTLVTKPEALESEIKTELSTTTKPITEHLTETVTFITKKPASTLSSSSTNKPTRPTRPARPTRPTRTTRPARPTRRPTRQSRPTRRPLPPLVLRPPAWFPRIPLLPPGAIIPSLFLNPFNTSTNSTVGLGLFPVPFNFLPLSNLTNLISVNRYLETRPPLNAKADAATEARDLAFWNALFHGDYKGLSTSLFKQSDEIKENKTDTTTQSNWKPWNFKFPKFGSGDNEKEEPVTIPANTTILHVYFPLKYPFRGQMIQTPAKNLDEEQKIVNKYENVAKSAKTNEEKSQLVTTPAAERAIDFVTETVDDITATTNKENANEKASLTFEVDMPKPVMRLFKGFMNTFMPEQN